MPRIPEDEHRLEERLREARTTVRAPASLRAQIETLHASTRAGPRPRSAYGAALAGALGALLLVLVLVLGTGAPGSPSVSQAAALADRGTAAPAPRPDPSAPGVKLAQAIEDVYFPNWSHSFGWTATGQRVDRIGGRRALTVYYASHGRRIAYTIVAVPALAEPPAQRTRLNGTDLRTFPEHGRLVVTWRRAGHTCVLSGTGVSAGALQALAAWKASALLARA